jgi:hypothetical protein
MEIRKNYILAFQEVLQMGNKDIRFKTGETCLEIMIKALDDREKRLKIHQGRQIHFY